MSRSHRSTFSGGVARALAWSGVVTASVAASSAQAADITLKLEPGVAIPLTAPQSDIYDIGGTQSLKVLFGITPYFDMGPSATFTYLPASADNAEGGVIWMLGGGLRFMRPHDAVSGYGLSPWIDADGYYVRTGDLNRGGLDVAAGLSIPTDEFRTFWVGPFVRYSHVFQGERDGYDNRDAKVLAVGVAFEFGGGLDRPATAEPTVVTNEVIKEVTRDVPFCADRDKDGVPDSVDRCPDVVGTEDAYGCPEYARVVVEKGRLDLKENVYFAYNEATLDSVSYPVLDDVAKALDDNKGFRVQIEGHTDSSGTDAFNQGLSERRAQTVLEYLTSKGIAADRLTSKGFGEGTPTETNDTPKGREQNRRVNFLVNIVILNEEGGAQ